MDAFSCRRCGAIAETITDRGASIAVVRHQASCAVLVWQVCSRWRLHPAALPDTPRPRAVGWYFNPGLRLDNSAPSHVANACCLSCPHVGLGLHRVGKRHEAATRWAGDPQCARS